ncbi:hypothetical protein [Curtobacterium sp. MCSS17_016]|uniref:hypothetical protein n=1 Tax=Curtobacterium sp. MCSS17_016 TaxID=2175644 RepID=UPI000DA81F69|nr:hypothetical protein [Curtobacterium sp. MCSS17_016]WIE81483.1 hypothetical protein DEJ19_019800 [Curtobacterium sp. MCSS17_016]
MRGTSRSVTAVVIVAALAATITGCSKASTPTIYSHSEAVAADDEMFEVLNDTIDATGGLQAWRAWSSNEPLDNPVGTGKYSIGGGECMPTNWLGSSGDPLGTYDGALLNSAGTFDGPATAETVKKIWRDAGFTDITTERGEGGTTVRGKHDDPTPVLTFTYGRGPGKQKASLEGESICQSYDYLDDDTLDDDRYDGDE